jgi:mannonate dehydratase
MFPHLHAVGIDTICFNFMAHVGWHRTRSDFPERGGAKVTAFDLGDFKGTDKKITKEELWANYEYFINAAIPEAEKHGIKLALHPDDPPLERLSGVERIMISRDNIRHAVYGIKKSDSLGITMCQANFHVMGEDIKDVTREFKDKIMFVHFRNTKGTPTHFRETFHDNGDIDMADVMRCYIENGIDVPVRVDHVPTLAGEVSNMPGYDALGRMFAIGYLKGILDSLEGRKYD